MSHVKCHARHALLWRFQHRILDPQVVFRKFSFECHFRLTQDLSLHVQYFHSLKDRVYRHDEEVKITMNSAETHECPCQRKPVDLFEFAAKGRSCVCGWCHLSRVSNFRCYIFWHGNGFAATHHSHPVLLSSSVSKMLAEPSSQLSLEDTRESADDRDPQNHNDFVQVSILLKKSFFWRVSLENKPLPFDCVN